MRQKYLIFILVFGLAALQMGVIMRTEDPIRDTETDPILYKQKLEEEKDGKKGPLAYNVKYNPSGTFLTDPPFAAEDEDFPVGMYEEAGTGAMDWWEEVPVAGETPSRQESGTVLGADDAKEEAAPSASTGEYWW